MAPTEPLYIEINNKEMKNLSHKTHHSITFEEPSEIQIIPDNSFLQTIFENSNIHLPDSITEIAYGAFMQSNIRSLKLGINVNSIGIHAFSYNTQLSSIDFNDSSITSLNQCFRGCTALNEVILPKDLKIIDEMTFESCFSIVNIELPESLIKIGASAFQNCKKLETIRIPKNVVEIGNYAFSACSNIKEVYIENISNIKIGPHSFQNVDAIFLLPYNMSDNDLKLFKEVVGNVTIKYNHKEDVNGEKQISLDNLKKDLYDIINDIEQLNAIHGQLNNWLSRGINLEKGVDEINKQYIDWNKILDEFILSFIIILKELIVTDDNIKSDYTQLNEDIYNIHEQNYRRQVDILCETHQIVITNLNNDIKLLNEAYNTLGQYAEIGLKLGNGLETIRDQIEKIENIIIKSDTGIRNIYNECELFSKIVS